MERRCCVFEPQVGGAGWLGVLLAICVFLCLAGVGWVAISYLFGERERWLVGSLLLAVSVPPLR